MQIVIGHTGNSLPETPEPQRKFVIGEAANGQEVRRPVARNRAAIGAAAGGRVSRPSTSSRSQQTVIGAAANSRASRPSTTSRQRASPSPSRGNNRGSGIVIGLRHNNRKRSQ